MFSEAEVFTSYSVDDAAVAMKFYGEKLGLKVKRGKDGHLRMQLNSGGTLFVYEKPNHVPATFTVLNFLVNDIEATAKELFKNGIHLEYYMGTDDRGIQRAQAANPDLAWFKDPAGNIISVSYGHEH